MSMLTETITVPNVQLTFDQIVTAIRQLRPEARLKIQQLLAEDDLSDELVDLALMSESALAREWDTDEEDEAWSHLAQLPSL